MENKITFVVFTFNEERRIEFPLRCFKDFGNILLVDNMSTDKTVEIAKSYGADICIRKNEMGWAEEEKEVENILSRVKTEWVYWGYADELCTRPLLKTFVKSVNENKYDIIYTRRKNIHYGKENLGLEHAYQIKLFRKGSIDFKDNKIHYFGKIVCPSNRILYLSNKDNLAVYHFSTYNINKFINNTNIYSDVEAKSNVDNKITFSIKKLLFNPFKIFIKYYFMNGGWKGGIPGFIMTMQYCFFRFNVFAKTWELENNINLETIEQKYDKLKEKLLHSN